MNKIEKSIKFLNLIDSFGYEGYIVGGAVRDYLLGMPIYDIDITTSMPIEELKCHFDFIDNGSKYLSITILFEELELEVTNYRSDISYTDHRHPSVKIVDDINSDVVRRDFTINAILIDKDFNIIDKFNGKSDIDNKLIRAIGNPETRFEEDALRILRGLYLYTKLSFNFEDNTLKGIINKKGLLASLSNERLYEYFLKLLEYKTDRLIKFIEKNNLFNDISDYLLWLKVAKNDNLLNNTLRFYLSYKKLPPYITNKEKKYLKVVDDIKNSNFDILTIYQNKEYLVDILNVLDEYDINLKDMINDFKIKSDKELAVSKEEIASHFESRYKKHAINEVIRSILEGKIKNSEYDINNLIVELSYAK